MMIPHPSRFPEVTWNHIAQELDRELGARERTYSRAVAKGNMTETEATRELALCRAWREDLGRFERAHAPIAQGRPMTNPLQIPALHGLDWPTRRTGLRRELALRERYYPGWIAKGNMTEADARRQTRALEAMLALYEDGLDFPGTRVEFADLVAEHIERAREGQQQQKELAL